MSNSVQGIHDGNGQSCRFPEAGEADGMSLAGLGEPDSTPVSVADRQVFIEGALFLQKRCGGESYNPKTHYCMDGAVRQYPDPKALAELVAARQRALAERRAMEAKGVVFCGPDESSEDCWARAGERPGADNFTYEDLPGWAQVVVDVGEPVAVVATATAVVLTAPVSAVVLGGGALLATGCASEDPEIPKENPVARPTTDVGDPTKKPTPENPDAKEPPPIVATIKARDCLPVDYEIEMIVDVQGAKQPKLVKTDEGDKLVEGDPVDGCSRILLDTKAESYDEKADQVTYQGVVGRWNSHDVEYGKYPLNSFLIAQTQARGELCGPLSNIFNPEDDFGYGDIYPDLAEQASFCSFSDGGVLTISGNNQCQLDGLTFKTLVPDSGKKTIDRFVLPIYSSEGGADCQGVGSKDIAADGSYWGYTNETVIDLPPLNLSGLKWIKPQGETLHSNFIEVCGPQSPCKAGSGSSVESVTVRFEIRPKKP